MTDNTNFLDQINSEKKEKAKALDSFKEEKFVKTKSKTNFLPYIFIIVIMVVGFFGYQFLTADKVVIVDFTGMDVTQVESFAANNEVMLLVEEAYDPIVEEGLVVSQNFDAGYLLQSKDTLVIQTSKGPDPYEVIDLPGFDSSWSKSAVQVWVENKSIDNYAFKYIEDDQIAGDYLINYVLTGATSDDYSRSANLEFIFSQVQDSSTVVMENFVGDSLTTFDTWVTGEGFNYTYTEAYSDIYSQGQIISQNFMPDSEKSLDDILEVVVSLGPSTEKVTMLNLVNMSSAEARAWANENGLIISITNSFSTSFSEYKVMEQSVAVGEEVSKGTNVSLVISSGEAASVPDFSNYTYANHQLGVYDYLGQVIVNQQYSESVGKDKLISQSIRAGSLNDGDKALEVVYSLGNEILIPDFRSGNLIDIKEWMDEQNTLGASLTLSVREDPALNEDYGVIFTQNYYNKVIGLEEAIDITIATKKTVPDFSQLSLVEAQIVQDTADYPIIIEQEYIMDREIDSYIWQSVKAGTSVENDTIVTVKYSLGMEVILDDYRGQPLSSLKETLLELKEESFYVDFNVVEKYDSDIPYGNIITQSIINSTIALGDSLEVLVSLGESYVVDDFIGLTQYSAESLAKYNGVFVTFIEVESDGKLGTIVEQSVAPGETISLEDHIYLSISK